MSSGLLIVVGVVLAAAVFLLFLLKFLERKPKKLDREIYRQYWKTKIIVYLADADKYPLAIIEADKLLDRSFRELGLAGQTMGERLVSAGRLLSDKESVWRAHKLRNRLVHEMDIQLNKQQTKQALAVFARALKDMGAI